MECNIKQESESSHNKLLQTSCGVSDICIYDNAFMRLYFSPHPSKSVWRYGQPLASLYMCVCVLYVKVEKTTFC